MQRIAAVVAIALALAGCAHAPAKGNARPRASKVTAPASAKKASDVEIEWVIGKVFAELYKSRLMPYDEPRLARYVSAVTARLAAHTGRPEARFEAQVTDSPAPDACSMLGGRVYISRGLLAYFDSEAELAAVLAHEMGHVSGRHAFHGFWRRAADLHDDSASPYPEAEQEEDQQLQADRLGLSFLRAAGYAPRAQDRALRTSAHVMGYDNVDDAALRARLARLTRHGGNDGGGEIGRDAYLDHLDGLVYGADPRDGAIRGRTYLHARTGFTFDLPEGWTGEMEDSELHARSPRGKELDCSYVRHAAPDVLRTSIVEDFLPGTAARETVSGLSVVLGTVQGKTKLHELAMIADGEVTYLLLTEDAGAEEKRILHEIVRTVRRTREADTRLTPARIRIRRAAETGPFQRVIERTCNRARPAGELAKLNGEDLAAPIEAGRRLKCIAP
ncbi:Zn-dependent protease [Minicystis rosea]|nr:Zn-dependent protease [Minicystis rosea]